MRDLYVSNLVMMCTGRVREGEVISRSTRLDPADLAALSGVLKSEDPSRAWELSGSLQTVEEVIAHLSKA